VASFRRLSLRVTDDAGVLRVIVPEEAPLLTARSASILLEILMDAAERTGGKDDSPPA